MHIEEIFFAPLDTALRTVQICFMENKVRTKREKLGLTLKEMGKALDVNLNTVWRWEQGRTKPSKATMIAVSLLKKKKRKDSSARTEG